MKHRAKTVLRTLGSMADPSVSEQKYAEFFRHPCWLALRHHVGIQMDMAADTIFQDSDIDKINQARGALQALMFLFEGEDALKELITDNLDALEASLPIEKRLEAVLKLVDSELQENK